MSKYDLALGDRCWSLFAPHLMSRLGMSLASLILSRATERAIRDVAALDDRVLTDVALDRAELTSLFEVLNEARTAACLAQLPGGYDGAATWMQSGEHPKRVVRQ